MLTSVYENNSYDTSKEIITDFWFARFEGIDISRLGVLVGACVENVKKGIKNIPVNRCVFNDNIIKACVENLRNFGFNVTYKNFNDVNCIVTIHPKVIVVDGDNNCITFDSLPTQLTTDSITYHSKGGTYGDSYKLS